MTSRTRPSPARRWFRQAAGIYRASRVAHLRPQAVVSRATWLLGFQAVVVAGLLALLDQAPGAVDPAQASVVVAGFALVGLGMHQLRRLAGVQAELLRDADQQVLETLDASPLPSSAFVAGRLAFAVVEQLLGFVLLLPLLCGAWLLGALDAARAFAALPVALAVVTLAWGALAIGGVLRLHGRQPRGVPVALTRRPGPGAAVALSLLGVFVVAGVAHSPMAGRGLAALTVLALDLAPAVPLYTIAAETCRVELFGRSLPAWLPALAWLALLAPWAFATARLRWKPPARASGADLRVAMALASAATLVVLSGCWRTAWPHALLMSTTAVAGAIVLPAWGGASELADVGAGGARAWRVLSMRRDTSPAFCALLLLVLLLLLALLAPPGLAGSAALRLAGGLWCAALPTLALVAVASRGKRPSRTWLGVLLVAASGGSLLPIAAPGLLHLLTSFQSLHGVRDGLEAFAEIVAALSPLVLVPAAGGAALPDVSPVSADMARALGDPPWRVAALVHGVIGVSCLAVLGRRRARAP